MILASKRRCWSRNFIQPYVSSKAGCHTDTPLKALAEPASPSDVHSTEARKGRKIMASPVVPTGGNQDRGPAAVAIYWSQTGVAILIVAARFYARTMIKGIGRDDWFMLATLVSNHMRDSPPQRTMRRRPDPAQKIIFIAISCLITYQASIQGFRHLFYLQPEQIPEVAKINYILQVLGIFSYVTAKASVGCLILRLLPPKSRVRKSIIWSVIIFTFIVNSLNCIFTFAQCDPPKALWEPNIPAHCWNPKVQPNFAIFITCMAIKRALKFLSLS